MQPPKTVVILGAHRSGTSALAGLLDALGVHLGDRLRVRNRANPLGYFEDSDFLELNDRLVAAAGGSAWSPPSREAVARNGASFESEIADLIRRKSAAHDIWGWKATSTVLVLDLFLPFLVNPQFVAVLRDPLPVARSSVSYRLPRGELSLDDGLVIATRLQHEVALALSRHQGIPRHLVSYDKLVLDPMNETKRLAEFLGLPFEEEHKAMAATKVVSREEILRLRKDYPRAATSRDPDQRAGLLGSFSRWWRDTTIRLRRPASRIAAEVSKKRPRP